MGKLTLVDFTTEIRCDRRRFSKRVRNQTQWCSWCELLLKVPDKCPIKTARRLALEATNAQS